MEFAAAAIEAALDAWLAPFLDVLGRKTRRHSAPASAVSAATGASLGTGCLRGRPVAAVGQRSSTVDA